MSLHGNRRAQKVPEIPPEVLERAQRDIEEFFEKDLPDVSRGNMEWIMERLAPSLAKNKMDAVEVNPTEVDNFLLGLRNELSDRISSLDEINFSRGHELTEKTYPTVEQLASLISWINSLQKRCRTYKAAPNFKVRFNEVFSPFMDAFLDRLKDQALRSRRTQLSDLHSR